MAVKNAEHSYITRIESNSRFLRMLRDIAGYVSIALICAVILLPFCWMGLSSFKSRAELFEYPPTFLPGRWTLGNYLSLFVYSRIPEKEFRDLKTASKIPEDVWPTAGAFNESTMFRSYANVIKIFTFSVVGVIIVGGLAGYSLAKIKFPGRETIMLLLIATIMIPWMVLLLPQYLLFRDLGWINTHLPLIAPSLLGSAFSAFFFRQHFRTIPNEIIESGLMDGATHWRIFWSLMMPLSKAVMATIFLFTLMSKWNELIGPLVYLQNPKKFTPVLVIYYLMRAVGNENDPTATGLRLAAATASVVPIIITFLLGQKYFVAGITQGSVKQ